MTVAMIRPVAITPGAVGKALPAPDDGAGIVDDANGGRLERNVEADIMALLIHVSSGMALTDGARPMGSLVFLLEARCRSSQHRTACSLAVYPPPASSSSLSDSYSRRFAPRPTVMRITREKILVFRR
jgi:hypothetical protein